MQQGFVVGCSFLITSVMGPIVWHLWIYSRSANANFYFGVTLAFATAQVSMKFLSWVGGMMMKTLPNL
jgi:phosphatidylinositol glycan class U